MPTTKNDVARHLANAHSELEDSVRKVIRLISDTEGEPDEPIKLLEVNTNTVPVGIMPISFGPAPDVPFPSVIIEITDSEYESLLRQELTLPRGWREDGVLVDKVGRSCE